MTRDRDRRPHHPRRSSPAARRATTRARCATTRSTWPSGRARTILDALVAIRREQDPTLTFRHSCFHASCGTCGMRVDGQEGLACVTPVPAGGEVTVEPLGEPARRLRPRRRHGRLLRRLRRRRPTAHPLVRDDPGRREGRRNRRATRATRTASSAASACRPARSPAATRATSGRRRSPPPGASCEEPRGLRRRSRRAAHGRRAGRLALPPRLGVLRGLPVGRRSGGGDHAAAPRGRRRSRPAPLLVRREPADGRARPSRRGRPGAGPARRRGIVGWFDPRGRRLGGLAFILNRLTGLGLVAYLYLHLVILSMLVRGPDAWDELRGHRPEPAVPGPRRDPPHGDADPRPQRDPGRPHRARARGEPAEGAVHRRPWSSPRSWRSSERCGSSPASREGEMTTEKRPADRPDARPAPRPAVRRPGGQRRRAPRAARPAHGRPALRRADRACATTRTSSTGCATP